ncbi:GNAT family N-acetyltransferase [Phenylobacterium sp. LjRoot219]|uniref:GNAT family N-acetyltransferase n=1 Tax=Phenylobacterium sp. LjRoot219 TaxID=3342283 RepID=UPI003ECED43A
MLRRAGPDDAETVAALGAATFSETFGHLYAPEDLAGFLTAAHGVSRARADLSDPGKAIWLLEAAGEAIGYVLAGPCDLPHPDAAASDGEIKRLYLLQRAQSGGWGGRLFDAALAWLQAAGPRAVWIGVWSENHGAQRFYARRGFEKVGEYGFTVGKTIDREFILRRTAESFSNGRR